jgi:hypothetical protein
MLGVAFDALRIRHALRTAEDDIDALRRVGLGDMAALEARGADAAAALRSADRIATTSSWLSALARVPGVGPQVKALRELTGAGTRIARLADEGINRLTQLADARPQGQSARTGLLDAAAADLRWLSAEVTAIEVPGRSRVAFPILDARRRLRRSLQSADAALQRSAVTLRGIRASLMGPTRYLLLAANNAEMRGAGGMPLQIGVVRLADGNIEGEAFFPSGDLLLDESVPVPPALEQLYGWLAPGQEWRNTSSSANFEAVAPLFAAMAEKAGLGVVDGVMQVDVVALRELLRAVGPVQSRGRSYAADDVGPVLLHEIYLGRIDHGRRRNALGQLALDIATVLQTRSIRNGALVRALTGAARGRHVMAWSRQPEQQAAWQALGVTGGLRPDAVLVAVQNHGGNKLDWFVRPSVRVTVDERRAATTVQLDIDLPNPTPQGLGTYVGGGRPSLPYGAYRGLVTAYLPDAARRVRIHPGPPNVVGQDGPMKVIAVRVDVPRGSKRTVTIEFVLPRRVSKLEILSSGRYHATHWDLPGDQADGSEPRLLTW